MKLPHLLALAILSLLFPACKHSSDQSKGPLHAFKITDYEIVSLPSTNLNLIVRGGGATPNSKVTVTLRYQAAGEVVKPLGSVTSDNLGAFRITSTQPCLFSAPSSPRFEATDVFTGLISKPMTFDPELLKCNY
jgi:hypothetical protein